MLSYKWTVRRLEYLSHAAVPILHRSGEVAFLERSPHDLVLGRRDFAPKDKRFGTPADPGEERAHQHVVRLGGGELGRDELSAPRCADPELASVSRHERSCSSLVNVGPMSQPTPTPRPTRKDKPSSPLSDVALGLIPLMAVSLGTCWMLALPTSHALLSVVPYAALGALLLAKLPPGHPSRGLGPANRLTLARATLVLPLAVLPLAVLPLTFLPLRAPSLVPEAITQTGYWWIVGLTALALALDGLDGPLARRTGTESRFGARFDMELDAFLLLTLSALVWQSAKAGPWVLLIGGLRYFFVVAGWWWQTLQGALPPSRRRKVICAVQGIVLVSCLAPVIPPRLATTFASLALLLLIYSFVVDTWWLARRAER
jgi:phosphatidylglycerophosphate synthase